MTKSILKTLAWGVVRAVITLSVTPIFFVIALLTDSAGKLNSGLIQIEVVIVSSVILMTLALTLLKRHPDVRYISYIIIFSTYAAIMLLAFRSIRIPLPFMLSPNLHIYPLFLLTICCLAALYYVFPIQKAAFILMLLPIASGAWFLANVIYLPLSVTYSVFLTDTSFLSEQEIAFLISLLPQIYLDCLLSGALALGTLLLYCLVRYGHNPKATYISLKQRW
ncbi:hypothetical protein L4C34_05015 [Vibrio profundum]|uniref:hypothetical protein n=1 Tax=Vibrio profundum TaxID=2910247 RepID=UPI003D0E1C79